MMDGRGSRSFNAYIRNFTVNENLTFNYLCTTLSTITISLMLIVKP